jgi:hypothetical protein
MIEESNILVSIRVRPLNQKEINMGDMDVVRVEDNLIVKRYYNKNIRLYWILFRWNMRLKIKKCLMFIIVQKNNNMHLISFLDMNHRMR